MCQFDNKAVTILFLNAGRRVELIRSFRVAFETLRLKGRIITTDISGLAPALYLGTVQYIMPHSSAPNFIKRLCEICEREKVNIIVPLIDPDLGILAQHRERIEETGAKLLLSDEQVIKTCRDKLATHSFLKEQGFLTPEVFDVEHAEQEPFPLFIKPRYGSASLNTFKITNREELRFFARYVPEAIIQQFVEGPCFTTDIFSDWSKDPIIAVPRKRLKERAGEVSVGRIERNPQLEMTCKIIAQRLGTVGPINVQAIWSMDVLYIIEINPRFGGGCPLSIAAGAPFAEWVILMALGLPIPQESLRLRDNLTMMRFDDSFFIDSEEIIS